MHRISRVTASQISFPYLAWFFLPLAGITLYPTTDQFTLVSKLVIMLLWACSGICLRNRHDPLLTLLFLFVLFCMPLWSINPSHSFQSTIQFTYYIIMFALFRSAQFTDRDLLWGTRMLVLVAIVISGEGLRQHVYGFQEHLQYLENHNRFFSPATEQITRDWIVALSGRVFSRFALPSQLASYLLMILPLNGLLIVQERMKILKITWGMVFLLNSVVLFYTKSFGAWLSLICLCMIGISMLFIRKQKITWPVVVKGGVAFLLTSGVILYIIGLIRGQFLWDFQGNNPLWYRFLNWKTAWQIFREHPFLGIGLSTFGKMYPQYMQPGANESQYVHNSYLQLATELGIIGGIFSLWFVGIWGKMVLRSLKNLCQASQKTESVSPEHVTAMPYGFAFSLSGIGFLLHNLVDFDVYVFPLGLLGMSLLALALNVLCPLQRDRNSRAILKSPGFLIIYAVVLVGLLFVYVKDWQYSYAKHQKESALVALQGGQYENASTHIRNALQYTPDVAEYKALEGNILLYLDQESLALQRFQDAIRNEPETPWFHAGLAESYLHTHNMSMAYVESRRAAELFPQKPQYQQRVQEIKTLLPF